jgi:hypothetical protein
MKTIDIDPPKYGPLRLGMTEQEVRGALGTLGHVSESGDGGLIYSEDPASGLTVMTRANPTGQLSWIASGPDGAHFVFRGIDLGQPIDVVLRSVHSLGLRIIRDNEHTQYLVEALGLLLAKSEPDDPDDDDDRDTLSFETVAIATPAQLLEATWAVHHRVPVETI